MKKILKFIMILMYPLSPAWSQARDKGINIEYNDVNSGRNIGLTYMQSFDKKNKWLWMAGTTYHLNNRPFANKDQIQNDQIRVFTKRGFAQNFGERWGVKGGIRKRFYTKNERLNWNIQYITQYQNFSYKNESLVSILTRDIHGHLVFIPEMEYHIELYNNYWVWAHNFSVGNEFALTKNILFNIQVGYGINYHMDNNWSNITKEKVVSWELAAHGTVGFTYKISPTNKKYKSVKDDQQK